jgi:hypothetical protein
MLSEAGMRAGLCVFAFCGLLSLQPVLTTAQVAPIELGVDATFDMSAGASTTSRLSIPGRGFRVGLFVSDWLSIENRMALVRFKTEGFDAATNLSLQVSGVIHFSPDRNQAQAYMNPTVGLRSSFRGDASGSQLELGCGVGVKIPVANYLSVRLEAGYWYGSENEDFDKSNLITVKAGVSLFTK